MKRITAIIIDDELPARELIRFYLKDFDSVDLVGEAENGFEGAKLVNQLQPDLVLLDIQMPKINGFEMLELLEYQPSIIFCTAYDEFAIKAFENNALDYLLKPFSRDRLMTAIKKINSTSSDDIGGNIVATPIEYQKPLDRIVVRDRKEIVIIDVADILYLEAQDDYVEIHTAEGKWLKLQTLKFFEQALDSSRFVRIHRRYILHLDELAKLDKLGKESYLAELKSGKSLQVSQSGYKNLKEQLNL